MNALRAMLVSVLLLPAGAVMADASPGTPLVRPATGTQIPARIARDPVLASLPVLLPQLKKGLQADQVSLDEVVTVSRREREIRHLLGVFLEQGTATVRRVGEAFLPEPQPGLQFNINPDTDEVYVGWRFQF
jgi:hypothetical protein